MAMYQATEIAKYIISLATRHRDGITHLKLQKILYYIQGAALGVMGKPVFNEDILAWKHGPVIYSVWQEYKAYGSAPLPAPTDVLQLDDSAFFDEVYKKYRGFTAKQLEDKTHLEPPWGNTDPDDIITQQSIRDYFAGEVYTSENILSDAPLVDALPTEDYDPAEDAEYGEWLKWREQNGKTV
jgi:uncharacterized phage-associated protein